MNSSGALRTDVVLCLCCFRGQVFEGMLLSKISGRDVQINACSATTGDGLREGLEWCIKKFEARGGGK